MTSARWRSGRNHAVRILAMSVALGAAAVILPTTPAFADTPGSAPNFDLVCGAYRDIPSEWSVVSNAGYCSGWGYSWIFTSATDNHFATWGFYLTNDGPAVTLHVEAWIPNKYAGQHTAYYYQLSGSSTWTYIGQLYQEADTGWYTPGSFVLPSGSVLTGIREHNTGGTSYDMAEDALGLSK
jgi:hypothetical protein